MLDMCFAPTGLFLCIPMDCPLRFKKYLLVALLFLGVGIVTFLREHLNPLMNLREVGSLVHQSWMIQTEMKTKERNT